VKDQDIDRILARAAAHEVDPALLSRVTSSIGASLRPVRPMAPAWMLASALLLISAASAVIGAAAFGMYGISKLSGAATGAIFSALGIFAWLAALISVGEMAPGRKHWMNPAVLLVVVMAGFFAVDAILFRDYAMDSFVAQGIPCLRAGLVVAVLAGIAGWLVLRRGFAVDRTAAGLAAGTLAGLAGLTMLEIHCPNFHAMHVMVWHTGVIPISALIGSLLGKFSSSSVRA
jgi:hypothetical protein